MSLPRFGLRLAQRQTTRTPFLRYALHRRYDSSTAANTAQGLQRSEKLPRPGDKLVGAADNAFNRERAAVRAHAAATSDLWRKLALYVVIPSIVLGTINAWNLWNEHWEHWEHKPPLEDRVEYPYQNIRTRNFFWGDGDKTLFWNDKVNYHHKDKVT